eukprot:jgi/Astpho2/442/fgenesh1_pg.00011_%23_34_t
MDSSRHSVERSTASASTTSRSKQQNGDNHMFPFQSSSARRSGSVRSALRNLGGMLRREWARQFGDKDKVVGWPSRLFESFLIVGLPPTTDVRGVVADVETMHRAKADGVDTGVEMLPEPAEDLRHRGFRGAPMPPEILYSYPGGTSLVTQMMEQVPHFCFPHGVQPLLLERTPSMSALNEVIYSQQYQNSDGCSFIFLMKVADNLPLYGVCCYMDEVLHRPPSVLKGKYPECNQPLSKYTVSAPRCYCFLTHYPFFVLHMKVLHMILGLERLDRIMLFMEEIATMPTARLRSLSSRTESDELPEGTGGGHQQGQGRQQKPGNQRPHADSRLQAGFAARPPAHPKGRVTPSASQRSLEAAAGRPPEDMAARHRALFETVQQGLALNQPGSLARFQQKLQDQRQQQLRQEQDGQDQQQQDGLLQGAGQVQAESSPQLQQPVQGRGLHAEESQQQQHTPPRSRGSAGSQELLGASHPVLSSPFLHGPAPDFAQQPPAQPTSTPASGMRGAGSASAIESPGSILKRASNRIKVALENQESGKTGQDGSNPFASVTEMQAGRSGLTESGTLPDLRKDSCSSFVTARSTADYDGEGAAGGTGQSAAPWRGHARNPSEQSLSGFGEALSPYESPSKDPSRLVNVSTTAVDAYLASTSSSRPGPTGDPAGANPAASSSGAGGNSAAVPFGALPEGGMAQGQAVVGQPPRSLRSMSFRPTGRSYSETDVDELPSDPANALQVMQSYLDCPVPQPGCELEFCPDTSLQPVHYLRPKLAETGGAEYIYRAAIAAAEAEAAAGLKGWTVAALCRSMSLENMLLMLSGVLLEERTVVFCPNIGLLTTAVLALTTLIRPFAWQHLIMPVLPASSDNFLSVLEAPFPFIIGVQYKTTDIRHRCSGLMRVNIYKNKIKNAGHLPQLPDYAALHASLAAPHAVLAAAGQDRAKGRPIYAVSDEQAQAADTLQKVLFDYLSSLCRDLHAHSITDVQSQDHVSILLKDSYIESFGPRNRPFIKQFAETQMFSVYCDSVIT